MICNYADVRAFVYHHKGDNEMVVDHHKGDNEMVVDHHKGDNEMVVAALGLAPQVAKAGA